MIQRVVVDASVAAQWLLPEETTPAALQVLRDVPLLLAPTLIYAEVANVLWKRVQRQEISLAAGERALNLLKELPLQTFSPVYLLPTAWSLAIGHGITMYDALYVALSQEQDAPLITADRRLHTVFAQHEPPPQVVWVEHFPMLTR